MARRLRHDASAAALHRPSARPGAKSMLLCAFALLAIAGSTSAFVPPLSLGARPATFPQARTGSAAPLRLVAQQGGRDSGVSEQMKKKLAAESEAPLRLPLLYGSAVLFGKGSLDAVFTVLKSLAGVSKEPLGDHTAMFALDVVCMAAGIALALRASEVWQGCVYNPSTWSTGKPWFLKKPDSAAE